MRIASPADQQHLYAALDLGSNSFHMIVARAERGQVRVLDRLREPVRLASGLDDDSRLSEDSIDRALQCLERMAQRVREFPPGRVRAVGTNALRRAGNSRAFLRRANALLGHQIEIIAGREEARLIYLGVVRGHTPPQGNQLVVDIGGGSTELIVGREYEPIERESLYMGCVSYSRLFFPGGKISRKRFADAELAARMEIAGVAHEFREPGWSRVVGASGTIKAIGMIAEKEGWTQHGISVQALKRLRERMIQSARADSLDLAGLTDDRRPVLAGGVAVLSAIFEELELQSIDVSSGALREGLLYDLIGRSHDEDVRPRTVQGAAQRYGVDKAQSARVARTAWWLLSKLRGPWNVDDEHAAMLLWAAQLHEIGLSVAHSHYHRHAEYLVANADMPGFSRQEQAFMAFLIRAHRRKFPVRSLDALPEESRDVALNLAVVLRLAVILHRVRNDQEQGRPAVNLDGHRLRLSFSDGWLDAHPLTLGLLHEEQDYLRRAGFELHID